MKKSEEYRKLYFLGIGGIGMSAIARYYLDKGIEVFGYDLTETKLTRKLEAEGMKIHYDDNPGKIPDGIDMVVYTPAIPKTHKELQWFVENGYVIKKRAEVLGIISRENKAIAIAGTHGKTSTSSLLAHVLKYCGLEASSFLGGIVSNYDSNYLPGASEYCVLEADEFDRSFLHLRPEILVILSMDADHLDIYKDRKSMVEAYEELCSKIVEGGVLVLTEGLEKQFSNSWSDRMRERKIRVFTQGEDFEYNEIRIESGKYIFNYKGPGGGLENVFTCMPGEHNVSNASIALFIAQWLDLDLEDAKRAMQDFGGIQRRFETLYNARRVLIDDYAHHPEELRKAIETVQALYPHRTVTGIFQPHLFSRTNDFYKEFASALEALDRIWLLDIYPARELPIKGVQSEMIFNLIRNDDKMLLKAKHLIETMKEKSEELDVIITLGASDIDKYHQEMIDVLKEKDFGKYV